MSIQLDLIEFIKNAAKKPAGVAVGEGFFQAPEASETADRGFESDVSRAVHSALIMRPIYELDARRFRQSDGNDRQEAWAGVDVLWLAFAVLDVISELTEYQIGATREEVVEKIRPLARRQISACHAVVTEEGLSEVLNKVFDHLVNRENRYLPFEYTYFDGATQRFRTRKFWLVKTVYTGEGREALYALTDEGYAAYFGLHETSALDAAAIGNLRIKLLIERGNVDDAISVADQNRKQCARKTQEVRNTRRIIRRNIHSVDFNRVHALAEEGIHQATEIQKEGGRLHNMVIENLQKARGQRHSMKLNLLAELLEGLNHGLMKLSGELQRLPEDYHRHSHKLFRRRSLGAFPPMEDVLHRVCQMAEDDAVSVGREFIARVDAPVRRPLFDPAAVIEACDRALERQNVPGDREQTILEIDGKPIAKFSPELTDPLMQQAFETLHTTVYRKGHVLLSRLLTEAAKTATEDLFPVAVAMAVFQSVVEPRVAQKHGIRASVTDDGTRIGVDLCAGRRYRGHELELCVRTPSVQCAAGGS
jgi:hypothetical protein